MKVFNLPRGSGKTFRLILVSGVTGYPIITHCTTAAKEIKRQADSLGVKIPDPIPIQKLREHEFHLKHEKVLVDEVMLCVQELFSKFGCDVQAVTMTTPMRLMHMK